MKIPNVEKAIVAAEKVRDYLLSAAHPVGRFKAAYFHSHGYVAEEWRRLEADIRQLLVQEAEKREKTSYGQKYAVKGMITTPLRS